MLAIASETSRQLAVGKWQVDFTPKKFSTSSGLQEIKLSEDLDEKKSRFTAQDKTINKVCNSVEVENLAGVFLQLLKVSLIKNSIID